MLEGTIMISKKTAVGVLLLFGLCLLTAPGAAGANESGETMFDDEQALNFTSPAGDEGDPAAVNGTAGATPEGMQSVVDGVAGAGAANDVAITADKETVVRNNPFIFTVSGGPNAEYYLYVRDAAVAANKYPYIKPGQPSVTIVDAAFAGAADGAADTLANAERAKAGGAYVPGTAAVLITDAGGSCYAEFGTNASTAPSTYFITVVDPADASNSGDIRVVVRAGEVTITAEGTGRYYIGEIVTLSGTNTDSDDVYLFMTGPNLGDGAGVALDDLTEYTSAGNYARRQVEADNTWEYRWDTALLTMRNCVLDAGSYTVYACSNCVDSQGNNVDKYHLSGVQYQTFMVQFRGPTLSLDGIEAVVAKGDRLTISGAATGNPDQVRIWIIGTRCRLLGATAFVEEDGTFSYTLGREDTRKLSSGQYYVVVQHPMCEHVFNVFAFAPGSTSDFRIANTWSSETVDLGPMAASDAVTALIDMIESPNCDDIYRKFTFSVEEPWIAIDPVANHTVGDTFTVTGSTNLAVGDTLVYDMSHASFNPTVPGGEPESGAAGTTTVRTGTGTNEWSFEVNTTRFHAEPYEITVESVEVDVSKATTLYLDGESYTPPDPPAGPTGGNYGIEYLLTDPETDKIAAGENVSLYGRFTLKDDGDYTFPSGARLEMHTDLEKPCWQYAVDINCVPAGCRTVYSRDLTINGFDLSYRDDFDVRIRLSLTGNASSTSLDHDQTLLAVRQVDGDGACVNGSEYLLRFTPSGTVSPGETDETIALSPGWNFVSTPKAVAADSDTASIFAGVDTAGHSVLRYDTASQTWEALKGSDTIRPLEGYWIYSATAVNVPLSYAAGSPQAPPERTVTAGWNAVGFSDTEPAAARDTLLSLGDAWSVLMGFDAAAQAYETSIIRGGSGDHSDAGQMQPTKGYWLYLTENGTLAAIGA